jgi:hypothetical protein
LLAERVSATIISLKKVPPFSAIDRKHDLAKLKSLVGTSIATSLLTVLPECSINRYYDPATDEFMSIDPDVATTDQPYLFTGDDPLNAEDPLGQCWGCSFFHAVAHVADNVGDFVNKYKVSIGLAVLTVAFGAVTFGAGSVALGGFEMMTAEYATEVATEDVAAKEVEEAGWEAVMKMDPMKFVAVASIAAAPFALTVVSAAAVKKAIAAESKPAPKTKK